MPPSGRHHAGLHQFKAREERRELVAGTHLRRRPALAVHLDDPLPGLRVEVARGVRERQVASGRQGFEQLADDPPGLVLVAHQVQQGHQGQRDRLGEVEGLPRRRDDLPRFPHVAVDVGGLSLRRAVQQRLGVPEDDRIVVRVHHPGLRDDPLDDLVEVRLGRNAGADVEELPDASPGQQPGGAVHEQAVGQRQFPGGGEEGDHLLGRFHVDRVVVLPAEVVVVHACRVGFAGVDLSPAGPGVCHVRPPHLRVRGRSS
ncbi:hypothetical protein GCM10010256_16100 [Streptomyces coeruleorubidus]|nr:hypothetical protein GCM10010256_16100 [Streptomyces coeruleorubidus]